MRTPIIAGNWKMNYGIEETSKFIDEIKAYDLNDKVEAVLCVPYTNLTYLKEKLKDSGIKLGAQNMHWEDKGAYTGEISPTMLKEIGIDYCIIGHSERRQYFNESDESVNYKIYAGLHHGIKPILCVGESLEEREGNNEKQVVEDQLIKGLKDVKKENIKDIVIAYEPIWAIGTGKTASSDDADEMAKHIRMTIEKLYDKEASDRIRIQYGGSVKPSTIKELMDKDNIDGALVGGASLNPSDFEKLINY